MIGVVAALLTIISTDPRVIDLAINVEQVVDTIGGPLNLSAISFRDCGFENAWYHPDTKSLEFCTELAHESDGYQRFVAAHEIGHAVIDAYHVPYTGSEEVAADEFAALMLMATGSTDDVVDAVVHYDSLNYGEDPTDEHPSPARRAWNLMCLVDGASRSPASESCVRKFAHATQSWMAFFAPAE